MILLNESNIDHYYREYLRQYKKTKDYITQRGGKMRDLGPLNREHFKIDFISELFDKPKTAAIRIARGMAKDEIFIMSYARAEKMARAHADAYGVELTIELIMRYRMEAHKGRPTIWDIINKRREQLKEEGLSTYKSNEKVGQEYFGSE